MIGTAFQAVWTALHYGVRHPIRAAAAVGESPAEAWTTALDKFIDIRERRGSQCAYEAENDWEMRLHSLLGLPWPCAAVAEFWALLPAVLKPLNAMGLRIGPESFGSWNDGDPGLLRAVWCLVRHLRPTKVVETGVAHGMTSRFILEALERNGTGHLWSIDLPTLNLTLQPQIGIAVGDRFPDRWTYIRGSSRRQLPPLLAELGQIELFIHDSLHSERNVRFELDRAWKALTPGGALVVDDVDANWGFRSFTRSFSGHSALICEAEPLEPDRRRFNDKGLFGIIRKDPATTTGGGRHGHG